MEHGFYHPERGYWQTIGEPSAEILATYPEGTVQVPLKPGANFEWQNGAWTEVEPSAPPAPDRVSRRQFGMQLIISGHKAAADAWVAQQDELTQWAYANSDTFVRTDPMMQAGFAAMGFTEQQVDEFFAAAAAL